MTDWGKISQKLSTRFELEGSGKNTTEAALEPNDVGDFSVPIKKNNNKPSEVDTEIKPSSKSEEIKNDGQIEPPDENMPDLNVHGMGVSPFVAKRREHTEINPSRSEIENEAQKDIDKIGTDKIKDIDEIKDTSEIKEKSIRPLDDFVAFGPDGSKEEKNNADRAKEAVEEPEIKIQQKPEEPVKVPPPEIRNITPTESVVEPGKEFVVEPVVTIDKIENRKPEEETPANPEALVAPSSPAVDKLDNEGNIPIKVSNSEPRETPESRRIEEIKDGLANNPPEINLPEVNPNKSDELDKQLIATRREAIIKNGDNPKIVEKRESSVQPIPDAVVTTETVENTADGDDRLVVQSNETNPLAGDRYPLGDYYQARMAAKDPNITADKLHELRPGSGSVPSAPEEEQLQKTA